MTSWNRKDQLSVRLPFCIFIYCIFLLIGIFSSFNPVEATTFNLRNDVARRKLAEAPNLVAAKELINKLLSLIYNRYEFYTFPGRQFVLTSNNLDKAAWDITKFKLAHKIVTGDQSFLMVFGGSSVTASHDNYYNQSYPAIFEKRMSDIFKALGIELLVHNIAQGANNCVPYIHCYEAMGGLNPDFIGWEQSYNCGRDNGVFEAAARIVGWSDFPGIAYFSASGAWLPKDCPPSPDPVPYCAEEWTPAAANVPEWNPSLDDVMSIREALFKFNEGKPSSARFTSHYNRDYKNVGVYGFNVWEQNPHCTFINKKTGRNDSCNGIDAAEQCTLKFMSYEASLYGSGGNGANWHPSRAFHLLRGEMIVWLYSLILYDAITMIEIESKENTFPQLSKKYADFLHGLGKMPGAKYCGSINCDSRPTCFTDFAPHFPSNMTLSELLVGTTKWTYEDAVLGDWSIKFGYKDAKPYYYTKTVDDGEIHLRVPVGDEGKVWLCGHNKESLLHATFYVEKIDNPKTFDKTQYVPSSSRTEWKKKKYMGAECKELHDLSYGEYVISIQPGDKNLHLSYVVTWLKKSKWISS